ncbi:MAG: hypothetical protein WC736_09515 [Gallionella sp.]|jgi:hypothetical protein
MKSVHLVITDLFLPPEFAREVCAGLHLTTLEKILSRGKVEKNQVISLEDTLCGLFSTRSDTSIAQISAAYDGLGEGGWLRADPVHLRLQREQVVLLPEVEVSTAEALQFCASLNKHFAADGLTFFTPDPQRWYVKQQKSPDIVTVPMSQAAGRNIHGNLPSGLEYGRWHQIFNEIQMLLFAHPLNEAREARGELPVNSVWFWGNQPVQAQPQVTYDAVSSDEVLVQMLARANDAPFSNWQPEWSSAGEGGQLLVWTGLRSALQRGDLNGWRERLQHFEDHYAAPLWHALRSGKIDKLQLEVAAGDCLRRFTLTRGSCWAFWRKYRPLADYSV